MRKIIKLLSLLFIGSSLFITACNTDEKLSSQKNDLITYVDGEIDTLESSLIGKIDETIAKINTLEEKYDAKVLELEGIDASIKETQEEHTNEINSLNYELDSLNAQYEAKINELESKDKELKDSLSALELEIANQNELNEAKHNSLTNEIEKTKGDLAKLEEDYNNEVKTLNDNLGLLQKELDNFELQVANQDKANAETLNNLLKNISEVTNQITALDNKYKEETDTLKETQKDLQEELDVLESRIENNKTIDEERYNALLEDINEVNEELSALSTKHNNEVKTLSDNLNLLQKELDDFELQVENQDKANAETHSSLLQSITNVTNELSVLDTKHNNDVTSLNEKLDSLQKEFDDIETLMSEQDKLMKEEYTSLVNQLEEVDKEIKEVNENQNKNIKEIEDNIALVNETHERYIETLTNQKNEIIEEINTIKTDIETLNTNLSKEISDVKTSLNLLESMLKDEDTRLQGEITKLNNLVDTLSTLIESNNGKINELQQELGYLKSEVEDLRNEIEGKVCEEHNVLEWKTIETLELELYEVGYCSNCGELIHRELEYYAGSNYTYQFNTYGIEIIGYNGYDDEIEIPTHILHNGKIYKVVTIGDNAFSNFSSLTNIEIHDSITSIGSSAFSGCSSLTSIEIPKSITSIGSSAFSGCSSLTSIEIPESITSIGFSAFSGCSSLTSIEIPKSVTSIGPSAFSGCSSLTNITIQDSVTSIGSYAFRDCSSLTSIEIPNSLTNIGFSAFLGCSSLTNITIPNSVTSIRYKAFSGCSSLTNITIPNSVTSIDEYAFSECSSLTIYCEAVTKPSGWSSSWNYDDRPVYWGIENIIESNGVQYIIQDNEAIATRYFGDETSVEILSKVEKDGVTYHVTSIGPSAFSGCSSLTSIEIPKSVTSIGESAFSECGSLECIYYYGTIGDLCNIDNLFSLSIYNIYVLDENNNWFEVMYYNGSQFLIKDYSNEYSSIIEVYKDNYYFEVNENGEWISNNKNVHNSKATMWCNPKIDGILTFDVVISSESGYDKFNFDGQSLSGEQTRSISINMTAGNSYTLSYSKDGSNNTGNDNVILRNIKFTVAPNDSGNYLATFNSNMDVEFDDIFVVTGILLPENMPELPIIEGYEFDWWYYRDAKWDFNNVVTENITLEARWNKVHTITFDYGYNDLFDIFKTTDYIEEPYEPTREGYVFEGWYNNDVEWDFATKVVENITLEARWIIEYTININYGYDNKYDIYKTTENYLYIEDPTRDGYEFSGWIDNNGNEFTNYVESDIEIIAQWTKIIMVRSFYMTGESNGQSVYDDNIYAYSADILANTVKNVYVAPSPSNAPTKFTATSADESLLKVTVNGQVMTIDTTGARNISTETTVKINIHSDYYDSWDGFKPTTFAITIIPNGIPSTGAIGTWVNESEDVSVTFTDTASSYTTVSDYKVAYVTYSGGTYVEFAYKFDDKTGVITVSGSRIAGNTFAGTFMFNADGTISGCLCYTQVDLGSGGTMVLDIIGSWYEDEEGFFDDYNSVLVTLTSQTKLDEPTNIVADHSSITWDAVEGALSYEVVINGTSYTTETNSFVFVDNNLPMNFDYKARVKAIAATIVDNSNFSEEITVKYNLKNVALSSNGTLAEASTGNGMAAIDGNDWSRWESVQADPQYLIVTLNNIYIIYGLHVYWEGANAAEYTVDVSTNGLDWVTVYDYKTTPKQEARHDYLNLDVPVEALFVRINGTRRGSQWGYSIFTLEVYTIETDEIPEVLSTTVYFSKPSNWDNTIYAYSWGGIDLGAWPGSTMKYDSSTGYYYIENIMPGTNIIFSDGTYQTEDLSVPFDGSNMFTVTTLSSNGRSYTGEWTIYSD